MPTTKELTIRLEDRPGTLGKLCQALAEQSINILAFHSCPLGNGKSAWAIWSRWERMEARSRNDRLSRGWGTRTHLTNFITVWSR
jgi:hypothetical protein